MAKDKNEFDFDFDDFDPKSFLNGEDYNEDIDFSEFSDDTLGLTSEDPAAASAAQNKDDLDLDDLNLDGFDLDDLDLDDGYASQSHPDQGDSGDPSDLNAFLSDLEDTEQDETVRDGEPASGHRFHFSDDGDDSDDLDFPLEDDFGDEPDFPMEDDFGDEPDFPDNLDSEERDMNNRTAYSEEEEPSSQQGSFRDGPVAEEDSASSRTARRRERRTDRDKGSNEPKEPKVSKPNVFTKLFDLYFGPLMSKDALEAPADPANPRRRRRKSKSQIFKEVYLPPIIACVCLILILSFVIGAVSNAITQRQLEIQQKESEAQASLDAAEQQEQEYQRIMREASELALSYDYQGAIDLLDSFPQINDYSDMLAKRAEYVSARDSLVEYKDFSLIPNLSFHVLLVDPARAYADTELGGKYNQNFVTTEEFTKILQQLYANNYVLVDFDCFIDVGQTVSGSEQFMSKTLYLPEGKKPFMLTETMVNYFAYMNDSNSDGVADAGGDGFASRLVLDSNGDIKAEYVDASGSTQVGNYDLVPILEDFIAEHPDFSYQGSRAILAVTGHEGIFGYRCNTSYAADPTKGNEYYEQEKAGAVTIVNALREKGYTLACYSYKNDSYANMTSTQIQSDLQQWTQQIAPVIGDVDTFVFAQNSDLSDYSGTSFNVMYQTGFRYFISQGKSPATQINNTYVHQDRLMVTGETMAWYSDRFTGMFDCNLVLDMTSRGSVPKS